MCSNNVPYHPSESVRDRRLALLAFTLREGESGLGMGSPVQGVDERDGVLPRFEYLSRRRPARPSCSREGGIQEFTVLGM